MYLETKISKEIIQLSGKLSCRCRDTWICLA